MNTRESIIAALFAALPGASSGVLTKSRTLKHWDDVLESEQPALFLVQESEDAIPQTGLPTKWMLKLSVYLYTKTPNTDLPPMQAMNNLMDTLTAALARDNLTRGTYTIGGLVEWCRIDGQIAQDGGALGTLCVSIVPLAILTV